MAHLTPDQFSAKWIPLLANNVFQDIDGVRLALLITDLKDSFAASTATANVPDWLKGTYYPLDYVILHPFATGPALFMKALAAGYLPVPSDPAGDASWAPALSPAADNALYQVGTVPALRATQGDWAPGRLYVLVNRLDAQGDPLPDVCVRALSAQQLAPSGYLVDGVTTPQGVSYDLATDTAQLPAPSYTQATINAMLAGLRDGLQDVPVITRDEAIAKMLPAKGLLLPRYVVLGLWNGKPAGVALMAATQGLFSPFGLIGSGNDAVAVLADVRRGTYTLLSDLLPAAVAAGTGRNVAFDQERHWPVISTSTYVVDATGAQVDVCFQLVLAQGCDEIKIPATGFVKVSPGLFDAASQNTYWFCVRVDGVVQYAITQAY